MDTNHWNPITAAISATTSILSAAFAFITLHDAQVFLAVVASGVAIISGFFAIRYYYHATKKIKRETR